MSRGFQNDSFHVIVLRPLRLSLYLDSQQFRDEIGIISSKFWECKILIVLELVTLKVDFISLITYQPPNLSRLTQQNVPLQLTRTSSPGEVPDDAWRGRKSQPLVDAHWNSLTIKLKFLKSPIKPTRFLITTRHKLHKKKQFVYSLNAQNDIVSLRLSLVHWLEKYEKWENSM